MGEITVLKERIETLTKENERLREEIKTLNNDLNNIELEHNIQLDMLED